MNEITAVFVWLLGIELIGLIAFPVTSYLCRCLPDRGYSISKPLGILLLTYFIWLPVSLHLYMFGQVSVLIALIILILLSALALNKKKSAGFTGLKACAVKAELVFITAFSVMALILSYKPDILAAASEDFMDYAFLQSILRSNYFPPLDPWLAGETLNYYYFGQLEAAVLTLFSGIPSNITYNLAVATFFGLTVGGAYGLGYNLTKRSLYGVVASIFASAAGMLSGFLQLLVYLVPPVRGLIHYAPLLSPDLLQWLHDFDFWTAINTVVPDTFVFYPYYAFVHGNLHAQIIGFSYQLMLLVLFLALLKDKEAGVSSPLFLTAALSLGFFAGLDTWEYPFYFMVLCLILFTKAYKKHENIIRSLRDTIENGGIAALAGIIFYIPYYVWRGSGGLRGVLPVTVQRTQFLDFIQVFGLFVFIILSFLLVYYAANKNHISSRNYTVGAFILAPALLIGVSAGFQLLPLLAAIILLAAYGAVKQRWQDEDCFSFLLIVAGGLVALFPEVLYVVDAMPSQRFNTQMKLYLQVWFLWGIASAYATYYIYQRIGKGTQAVESSRGHTYIRTVYIAWAAILMLLIFASLVHPIATTVSWTTGAGVSVFGSIENGTLDGTRYMQKTHIEDYMAIQWIEQNIAGNPTILEAPGEAYQYSSQVASMTGIPTVLGWKSHEFMWNNDWDKVSERENDINKIYSTTDVDESLDLLKKYNVKYIYVGENELAKYRTGLDKFENERYFERVYGNYAKIYSIR